MGFSILPVLPVPPVLPSSSAVCTLQPDRVSPDTSGRAIAGGPYVAAAFEVRLDGNRAIGSALPLSALIPRRNVVVVETRQLRGQIVLRPPQRLDMLAVDNHRTSRRLTIRGQC